MQVHGVHGILQHASNKCAKIAQALAVELCRQCWLIQVQSSVHLFSPSILAIYESNCLSTDIQNRHDNNAFQLPHSTAQCELIDIS
jgi:hypothetical protein